MTSYASLPALSPGSPGKLFDSTSNHRNRLFAAMGAEDRALLIPHTERLEADLYHSVAERGGPTTYAYFPETCVMSLVNRMSDGRAAEAGTIGNEGFAGLSAFLESESSESDVFCQVAGVTLRLPVRVLIDAAAESRTLRRLLNRYTHTYLAQIAQSVACNSLHDINQRCARWLLMTHDRVDGAETFPLKHEFLALMLGVRRAGVTTAAGALQDKGIIRYRRGIMRVVDRERLIEESCECYGIVRNQHERLLP